MRLTVIPEDRTIIKDGVALQFDFAADANIHAIQWYGDYGTIEQKVGGSIPADLSDVQPFVDAFDAEAARLAALPKPEAVPEVLVCSPRQIRQALTRAGLRSQVEAAVAAGDQDLKDWWEFSSEFRRDHPEVLQMAQILVRSNEETDDLFKLAVSL